jgi:hypothetical protein
MQPLDPTGNGSQEYIVLAGKSHVSEQAKDETNSANTAKNRMN